MAVISATACGRPASEPNEAPPPAAPATERQYLLERVDDAAVVQLYADGFANLPLKDLALLDNQASPVGLAHAAKIATLRRLDVSYAPTVTDDSLRLVAQMPALEEFKLGSAQVTDGGLRALAASQSLKKLSLSALKGITPQGIETLRKTHPTWVIEVN